MILYYTRQLVLLLTQLYRAYLSYYSTLSSNRSVAQHKHLPRLQAAAVVDTLAVSEAYRNGLRRLQKYLSAYVQGNTNKNKEKVH